jgi:hypothetical protein
MASSFDVLAGPVGPEETVVAALPVVPLAVADWSNTLESPAEERPEYSRTAIPTSAREVGVAVTDTLTPAPAVTWAVQTDISVWSDAAK